MRMTQERNRSGFALETPAELFGADFDGHFAAEPRVYCLKHARHASGGEQSFDSIRSQQGSRTCWGPDGVVQQVRREIAGSLFEKSAGLRVGGEHCLHFLP